MLLEHAPVPGEVVAPLSILVDELVAGGADTVWLAGSFARGDAGPYSDVDVGVLAAAGAGPGYRLEARGGALFSISWTTVEATRRSFGDPAILGAAVPGWQRAILLHDPQGGGGLLRAEADAFAWEAVADACDSWVSEQIAGYAEEVQKLCNSLHRGEFLTASVQRNVLTNRLALPLSVHHRILYDTENTLWSSVSAAMGEPWASYQAGAFCLRGESLSDSCCAALRLYLTAAEDVSAILDTRQRAVVDGAIAVARNVLAR